MHQNPVDARPVDGAVLHRQRMGVAFAELGLRVLGGQAVPGLGEHRGVLVDPDDRSGGPDADDPGLALVAYTPLLSGAYVRADKPLGPDFDHAGTPLRLAALREVAKETGATANQVVLAWLIGGEVPVIPLVGASSVAQLDESLAAVDLELTAEQRTKLDEAAAGVRA
jgi:hypothetical protein